MPDPIIMMASRGESTRIVFNALNQHFDVAAVIIEKRESRKKFIKRRARRLGWPPVIGQILFQGALFPLLKRNARDRIHDIKSQYELDTSPIPESLILEVSSVNEPEATELLTDIDPGVVIINGTRIIAGRVLDAVEAPFLNMHAGITPAYRGVHGGYWALAEDDPERCGVTVHLLDEGIDTGGVLAQQAISPTKRDNFSTYPYLQLGAGLPHLVEQIQRALQAQLAPSQPDDDDSNLWVHPTLPGYLYRRIAKGVQ